MQIVLITIIIALLLPNSRLMLCFALYFAMIVLR